MSILQVPSKGNLTISIMYRDKSLLEEVRGVLIEKYGNIDFESAHYNFTDISEYYDSEMGGDVFKVIFSFEMLIERDFVKEVKKFAVEIEGKYAIGGDRQINLDPGLLTSENFLLTTGKNFSHRIYLGDGVFAEITLIFTRDNDIKELEWTYRDYLFEPARGFLLMLRKEFKRKLKEDKRKIKV